MAPVGTPGSAKVPKHGGSLLTLYHLATDPREGSKPEPIGNAGVLIFVTICTLAFLYLLWRRASTLRAVVSHQLKTWTTQEGRIRLSEDDGPPATEFLADDEVVGRTDQSEPPTEVTGTIESNRAAQ